MSSSAASMQSSPPKTTEVMEVTPLPSKTAKSKPKDKTSPSTKVKGKTIRTELAKTQDSPIGIAVQHDAAQPSHPAPKRLLKDLCWRMSALPEGSHPEISMAELHQHIKNNRILYSPPATINLTLIVIETLASSHPDEKVHYVLEFRDRTVLSSTV